MKRPRCWQAMRCSPRVRDPGRRRHTSFRRGAGASGIGTGARGGTLGMIGGQMIDIEAPAHAFGIDEVILLQRLKTGRLFEFCCVAGPILAEAGAEHENCLREYARDFGLIFQITDDLLDVLSTEEKTGKAVGKDAEQGKATLVSLMGIEAARARAEELASNAAKTIAAYGGSANFLHTLPLYLLRREN